MKKTNIKETNRAAELLTENASRIMDGEQYKADPESLDAPSSVSSTSRPRPKPLTVEDIYKSAKGRSEPEKTDYLDSMLGLLDASAFAPVNDDQGGCLHCGSHGHWPEDCTITIKEFNER